MASDKVLVIVYYWPPSGGAGVQRWVKLTKYLARLGLQVFVLTVDEKYASYLQTDESLQSEISPEVKVYKTRSFEVINLFAKLFGKKKVPTAGFYNLDKKSLIQNFGMVVRTNLFIPDPRRGWNRYAYRQARQLIRKEGIGTVITSTPPHSSQLIGLKLKRKYNIRWISDLRDPWTDIYYYKILRHSFLSKWIDRRYELRVLRNADAILTVSTKLRDVFLTKGEGIKPSKIHVVPNGFDPEDFNIRPDDRNKGLFTVCYTGSMSDQYRPQVFFDAFRELYIKHPGKVKLQLVGSISQNLLNYIKGIGLFEAIELIPTVPHHEVIRFMASADALLLVIPDVENAGLILTGKLFEYLAAGRPVVLIGPSDGDAEAILRKTHSGEVFERTSVVKIVAYLDHLFSEYTERRTFISDQKAINPFNREEQAKKILSIIRREKQS